MSVMDPVTLLIFAHHCAAATESMAYALYRTAHSTFVKETEDFTTGLTTPEGQTFASPPDLGTTWFVGLDYANVIRLVPDYQPGDIAITNDPYAGSVCSHTPDIHLWKPVFHDGEIVCFAVGHVHNTDVGGAVPASMSRDLTEVHQEGLRLPPMKLYRAGVLNEDLHRVLLKNVRVPDLNWGDLKAQVSAMNTGERKVREIIARFGAPSFRAGMAALLDYSERQARSIIRRIPDGDYSFSDYLDEDSAGGPPCRLACTVSVRDDEIVCDLSDCDTQAMSSLNIPTGGNPRHALLMVAVNYVLYTLDPTLLLNSGLARPVRFIIPEGSIVNPVYPAAVSLRSLTAMRLQSVLLGCFAQALPDLLPAAVGDGGPMMNVRTFDDRAGAYVMAALNPITGGSGATSSRDGTDGSGGNFNYLKNTPVEICEAEIPVKILRYGLAADTGGPGRWRGGLATTLEFTVYSPETTISARNRDRTRFRPWGFAGGLAGGLSQFRLNPGQPEEIDLGNSDVVTIGPGDVVRAVASGGGGWGDPLDREPERVLADVVRGFISPAHARAQYGVVIADGQVDATATAELRRRLAVSRVTSAFGFGPERDAHDRMWTPDKYAALNRILYALPVNWRSFIKHRIVRVVEANHAKHPSSDADAVRVAFEQVLKDFPKIRRSVAASQPG